MERFIRISAILLLLINAVAAILAGWSFMQDPSGGGLRISTTYLQHSPFTDFFYPGLILFSVNGIFALLIACAALIQWKPYTVLLFAQGGLSAGWILVQMFLLRDVHYFHILFGAVALFFVFAGLFLHHKLFPSYEAK